MEVIIAANANDAGVVVADLIERLLHDKPTAAIGLATGSSPLVVYAELIRRCAAGQLSFSEATAFILDEYLGLTTDHAATYREFLRRELTGRIDLEPERLLGPDTAAEDPRDACAAYEQRIASQGIDLQLLGVGTDGHIGFNEPTSSLSSRTRVKTLTRQTRTDNARFFDSLAQVPHHVVTQGIGTILDARRLVLIACGPSKAEAVARATEGPVSAMFPASALQLHERATIVIDEEAAALLQLADYHRDVYANRPEWQRRG